MNDFLNSTADSSLFVYNNDDIIIWMVVYVDDLIITGNDSNEVEIFIKHLCSEFKCRDLCILQFLLVMKIIHNFDDSLDMNQTRYALDILSKNNMLNCKACKSPVIPNSKLTLNDGELLNDITTYRGLVGALQYLSQTRPGLTNAINQVAQFVHTPRTTHLVAAKRILIYLKGLHFSKNPHYKRIIGFSDANFAGDLDSIKSTTSLCVFAGGNFVTWTSKKQATVSR